MKLRELDLGTALGPIQDVRHTLNSEPKCDEARGDKMAASRLKVQEFMVLTEGGVPIFDYSPTSTKKLDTLLSGFLTAITSFASEFGERSVQSLTFEGSEILYGQADTDDIFILLVETGGPTAVLRAVLRDLSRKFIAAYGKELKRGVTIVEAYSGFSTEVQRAFSFYEGVLVVTSNLTSYVVPTINKTALEKASSSEGLIDEFHRDLGGLGNRILEAIDGRSTIAMLSNSLGLEIKEIAEVIEYLAIWGVVKVSKLCPSIRASGSRFDAFIEMVGLPEKDHQLLSRATPLCNGARSIEEVSERLGVTADRLHEVLMKMGNEIEWTLDEIKVDAEPL